MMVLALILIAAVSAFKVSVTKTASEKRFDGLIMHSLHPSIWPSSAI